MNDVAPTLPSSNRSLVVHALTLSGALALSLFFVWFSNIVLGQRLLIFDERVTLFFRAPANHALALGPPWLAEAVRDFTSLGSVTVSAVVITLAVVFLLLLKRNGQALVLAVSSVGSLALNTVLKLAIERQRPPTIDVSPLVFTSSFPSGHAALSMATYLSIAWVASRWVHQRSARLFLFGAAVILPLLVGLSRVYLGLHRPTDVVGGWVVGIVWLLVSWTLAEGVGIRNNQSHVAGLRQV
jgi:undecaprenyl-diphosphatase